MNIKNPKFQSFLKDLNTVVTLIGMAISLVFAFLYFVAHPEDIGGQFYLAMIFVFYGLYSLKIGSKFDTFMSCAGIITSLVAIYFFMPDVLRGVKGFFF